ncbi:hypothetical protein AC1031_003744 [Aphanomyces cochlioides]|nr:hypothetical protein AC1031_003744 [Aphanomyces cochlioides]
MGVLAKLKCPICIRPTNLMRWKERCVQATEMIDTFAERVGASCNVLCPNCHSPSNVLPIPSEQDTIEPVEMDASLLEQLPALQDMCNQFCQHKVSLDALCQFARERFPGHYAELTHRLVPLIKDTERRASLFLRRTREQPFIQSTCCKADICFTCKTKGHHHDRPCESMLATKEDVAACPTCNLTLVKGDGCDYITCFCGSSFSWSHRVMLFRWSLVPRRNVDALSGIFRPFVYFRRLRKRVLPELVFVSKVRKLNDQFKVVCDYLRSKVHQSRVRRLVLPEVKARVVMMLISKHKKPLVVVREHLLIRVWRQRFSTAVLQSKLFTEAIIQRRAKHCVNMVEQQSWIKARMLAATATLFRHLIQRRKRIALGKMMHLLKKDLPWIEMTDDERAVAELEQQDFFTRMFDMGDE